MYACIVHVVVEINEGDGNSSVKGQVEMKGYPNSEGKRSFYARVKNITIDWGDGTIDEITPNGVEMEFSHTYSNKNLQSIVIKTDKLISISHDGFSNPYFSELRFEDCPDLEKISFPNNQLIELSIYECAALELLNCRDNELKQLTIYDCGSLKELNCIKNKMTELYVDKFIELEALFCCCNELNKLNLEKNVNLKILDCSGNHLTELNLEKCLLLKFLSCAYNQLTVSRINSLIERLPIYDGDNELIGNFEERYGGFEPNHGLYRRGYLLTGINIHKNPDNIKGWVVY
jgi:Leucine-rich repeat (LRR) protein